MGDTSCMVCEKVFAREKFRFMCVNCDRVFQDLASLLSHFSESSNNLKCEEDNVPNVIKSEQQEDDVGMKCEDDDDGGNVWEAEVNIQEVQEREDQDFSEDGTWGFPYEDSTFDCGVCQKSFPTASALNRHVG